MSGDAREAYRGADGDRPLHARGLDLDPHDAAGCRRGGARVGAEFHRERPARALRRAVRRRRPLARRDRDRTSVPLQPRRVLARAGARDRAHRRGGAARGGAGGERRGAGAQRRRPADPRQGQAERARQPHRRPERRARDAQDARARHHQQRGQGLGRCRSRRGLGLRGHHARRLHRRPDAPRAGRRAPRAAPDRQPAVSGRSRALPAGDGSDHPDDVALHARQPGHIPGLRDRLRRDRADPRRAVRARPGGDRGDPRPHPERRGHDRRHHRRSRRPVGQSRGADRLRDRDGGLPAGRELHPAAGDHRQGGAGLRLHGARQRPGLRSALRADRGDRRRADRGGGPDRRGGADRPQKSSDRRRRTAAARLTHCSGRGCSYERSDRRRLAERSASGPRDGSASRLTHRGDRARSAARRRCETTCAGRPALRRPRSAPARRRWRFRRWCRTGSARRCGRGSRRPAKRRR